MRESFAQVVAELIIQRGFVPPLSLVGVADDLQRSCSISRLDCGTSGKARAPNREKAMKPYRFPATKIGRSSGQQ